MRNAPSLILAAALALSACGGSNEPADPAGGDAGADPADASAAGTDAGAAGTDAGADAGTSGGLSVIPCEPVPDNETAQCPGVTAPSMPTLLEALRAFEASAKSEFPDAFWQGGVTATRLDRAGKFTAATMLSTVAFCANNSAAKSDALRYYYWSGNDCRVERLCSFGKCPEAFAIPTIDSGAAIAAAFPGDPEGTLYGFFYLGYMGNYWTVSRDGESGTSVKVDAATGEVLK